MNTPTKPRPRPPGAAPAAATKPANRPAMAIPKASSVFDDLLEEVPDHGKFLMLYSEAGMGKTTLAGCFPDPIFITTAGEQGIHIYKQKGIADKKMPVISLPALQPDEEIPVEDGSPGWLKLIDAMKRFLEGQHTKKTLIIDSVSGLQDLCFQHCASKLFGGRMNSKDYTDFYRGYTKAAEQFWSGEFLPLCLAIVKKGYNVVLIAHSTSKEVDNPTGPNYMRYEPALNKQIWERTKKDLHGCYFLGQQILVAVDNKARTKKAQAERRFIGLTPSTYYIAKSWCTTEGVTEIDCGETAAETYTKLAEVLSM